MLINFDMSYNEAREFLIDLYHRLMTKDYKVTEQDKEQFFALTGLDEFYLNEDVIRPYVDGMEKAKELLDGGK